MFSNYSVKKILPRLVIIAIAVNLSFYICAALVDLSNIIGANIVGTLGNMGSTPPQIGIGEIVGLVIGIIIIIIVGGAAAILSLILIFLMIALRNIALTALIIISPIAFLLYLLPNTEKWFKKWLTEFTRMLFVYPMIAGVWGICLFMTTVVDTTSSGGFGAEAFGYLLKVCLLIVPAVAIMPIMKFGGQAMGAIAKGVNAAADKTGATKLAKGRDALRRKQWQAGEGGIRVPKIIPGIGGKSFNLQKGKYNPLGRIPVGMSNAAQDQELASSLLDKKKQRNFAASVDANSPNYAAAQAVLATDEEERIKNADSQLQGVSHADLMKGLLAGNYSGENRVAAIRRAAQSASAKDMASLISKGALKTEGRDGDRIRSAIASNKHIQSMGGDVASNIAGGSTKELSQFRADMDSAAKSMDGDKMRGLHSDTLDLMANGYTDTGGAAVIGGGDDSVREALKRARQGANDSARGELAQDVNEVVINRGASTFEEAGDISARTTGGSPAAAGKGGKKNRRY